MAHGVRASEMASVPFWRWRRGGPLSEISTLLADALTLTTADPPIACADQPHNGKAFLSKVVTTRVCDAVGSEPSEYPLPCAVLAAPVGDSIQTPGSLPTSYQRSPCQLITWRGGVRTVEGNAAGGFGGPQCGNEPFRPGRSIIGGHPQGPGSGDGWFQGAMRLWRVDACQ